MGKLYVVATPIGNLSDITIRAKEIIKKINYIACEDTRITSRLLLSLGIRKKLISFHQHSKLTKINYIIKLLLSGEDIVLVTDAGTPGISDPGGILIEEASKKGIEIFPVPGPSSVTAALSVSGFPADSFVFLGFFPKKKGRETLIKELIREKKTIVFFESPHRIKKTLKDLMGIFYERDVVVLRELTKKFEKIYRGKIKDIINDINPKGEFVVVVRGVK